MERFLLFLGCRASPPTAQSTDACSASTSRRRACKVETFTLRRAATERGESWCLSASKVARTTLYGFDVPIDFATTSCMPRVSNTARIGPPAMMPVPGGAARKYTLPAPCRPATSWCSVRPSRSGTRVRLRLAASVALRIASGTSRALPWPCPTRPFWSPTTTSAAKPKRRPPFTTLATRLIATSFSVNSFSRSSRSRCRSRGSRAMTEIRFRYRSDRVVSELEPALAGSLGQRLDAAVEHVAAAIEHDVLDALGGGALGHRLADSLRGLDVGAGLERPAHVLLHRGGGGDRLAFAVIDDLRIDVLRRAKDRQPWPLAGHRLDAAADARRAPLGLLLELSHGSAPLLLLAFFAEDVLACVFHALALVWLGLAETADLGGDLADLLPVDAGDHHLGRLRRRDRDAGRDRVDHVVAVAERDLQVLALHRGAVADAVDLELALEALGDAGDEVRHQRARGAPHRARAFGLVARIDLDRALLQFGADVLGQHQLEGALRPLHLHGLPIDARGDAGRDRDRSLADTRHLSRPPSSRCPAQNTVNRISPPTLASRAAWSAITPFGVEMIATPRPLLMRGRPCADE